MSYENVQLWFAKDESDVIITIDEIIKGDKNTYHCPVCGSDLKPKAIESKRISPHFAHVDVSKCNSESQIHFWFKHKFLEKGDKFTVTADKVREYICKDVLVEQIYDIGEYTYKPDVTVLTECGETVFFEMAFSNKKKVKDYLDIWLNLKNIVVEVDIKQLMFKDKIPTFKALFYDGKCFNTKRNDTYYNTIGKYKEEKLQGNVDKELKERIRKLDWFWSDIFRYNKGEVDTEHMITLIESIDNEDRYVVNSILTKSMCSDLHSKYCEYKSLDYIHNFYELLEKDSSIRTAVKMLNKKFKNIDRNYKVILHKNTEYDYETHWYNRKKRKIKRGSHYTYSFFLLHKLYYDCGWAIKSTNITNRISKMDYENEIVEYVWNDLKDHSILLKCKNCDEHFRVSSGEINFYVEKGLEYPKRCKSCRTNKK